MDPLLIEFILNIVYLIVLPLAALIGITLIWEIFKRYL